MYDLTVQGASIVQAGGLAPRTLAVKAGRVSALLSPEVEFDSEERLVADGCIVLPGLVDAHVHFREPGLTHKEDFESGSRAAALGGVTTVMVMPTDQPMTQDAAQFAEKRALAEGRSYVDFALQALLGPNLSQVEALARAGAVSFEIFLGLLGEGQKITDLNTLVAALKAVRKAGAVAGITPFDDALAARSPALPPEIEAAGVARALEAHRLAGGRIHLRQISSALAVEMLHNAAAGVTSEVTPHNLWLTDGDFARLGAVAKVIPPLRPQPDLVSVRKALRERRISIVATDHAPHTPQEKEAGLDKAPGGFPGVQTLLPLLLKMVAERMLSYEDVARVACEGPARIFGLYPRKGALVPGADADFVIVDPARPMRIRNADQASKAGRTPFDGWSVPATPVKTFLRGALIASEGAVSGARRGEFLGLHFTQ
jgi:dihydroorotase